MEYKSPEEMINGIHINGILFEQVTSNDLPVKEGAIFFSIGPILIQTDRAESLTATVHIADAIRIITNRVCFFFCYQQLANSLHFRFA